MLTLWKVIFGILIILLDLKNYNMKKLLTFATAAMLFTGAFAQVKKDCRTAKSCCKKDMAKKDCSTKDSKLTTVKVAKTIAVAAKKA